VGDVAQRVDGAQADGLESLLHPGGRCTVVDASDVAPGEAGAGVARLLRELQLDGDGAIVVAFDASDFLFWLERAEAGGCKIAGSAAHARAGAPVGRARHGVHRIDVTLDAGGATT